MIFSKDISGASKKLCFSSLFPNCFNDAGGVVEETRQTWMEFSIASPWRRLISSPTKFRSKKSSKHWKTIEKTIICKQHLSTGGFEHYVLFLLFCISWFLIFLVTSATLGHLWQHFVAPDGAVFYWLAQWVKDGPKKWGARVRWLVF